jgi:TP901 family phage tail tape measure protein
MAETLRELVVSLSLSSDNFNANLKSVNQRIKEAESSFKLASAGVDGFENTMKGAAAKLTTLKTKLDQQNKAVEQHEQKLKKANDALDKSRESVTKQATSLDDSKRAHTALSGEIAKAEAAFKASAKATGDNSEESIRLSLEVDKLKEKEKALATEIKDGEKKLEAATKSVQKNEDAVSRAQTGLNSAKAEVKETTSAIDKLSAGLGKAGAGLGVLAAKAIQAGESMQAAGRYLSTRVTAPLAALGAYAFKAAVDFEDAFAGVRKTVNATEEEFARLEQSIKDMSLEVPSSTTEIAGVMEAAGQLGIATENLESFSRTMIDLGNSTNIGAAEAATAIAQFSNITGMAQGDANRFGSALVDLGNKFSTNEQAIMNMSMRLAAAGAQVGLSETQILGFATALSSVGIEAEAGGTAFSKVMKKMEVAVATGKNGLEDFAKVSGMSQKEFQKAWKEDAAGAIEAFIVGLSKMDEAGISAIVTLEDMGLKEVRLSDTLLRATNATEDFARAQSVAASAWSEGTALATEAETRYNTLASQLAMLKNKVSVAAQSLGDEMVPMAKRVIEAVSGLIDRFMALSTEQKEQIVKWAAIAAAVGPALLVFGKITSGAGKTVQAILGITRAMKSLGAVNLGWIGLAVAGVAGLAVAIKALVDSAETSDKVFGRLFSNTDQDTVERVKKAMDIEIEVNVSAGNYVEKIDEAIDGVKQKLMENGGLTEKESNAIVTAIATKTGLSLLGDALGKAFPKIDVQPVLDAITEAQEAINMMVEGLGLSETAQKHIEDMIAGGSTRDEIVEALMAYGIEEGVAQSAVDSIFVEMDKISAAAAALGLSSDAQIHIQNMARAGATNNEIIAALQSYGIPKDTAKATAKTITDEMGKIDAVVEGLDLSIDAAAHIGMLISQNASTEEIAEALRSFGVEPEAAKEAAEKITDSMGEIDATVEGIGISQGALDALELAATGDRQAIVALLKLYGLEEEDIQPIIDSYDLIAESLLGGLVAALNNAYEQLTDGKSDTKAVMQGIKDQLTEAFAEIVDEIKADAEARIAALDPTLGDYAERVAEIRSTQEADIEAVTGYEKASWGIISGLANASKSEVETAWADIAALLEEAGLLVAKYEDLEALVNQAGQRSAEIVKAGAARDPETAGSALGYANESYKLDTARIKAEYDATIADLNATFDDKNTEAYTAAADAAKATYDAANAARLEAYRQELAALWAGLAESLADMEPELAAKLQEQAELFDMQDTFQRMLDGYLETGKLDASALSDKMLEAVAAAGPGNWTPEELLGMSPDIVASKMNDALTIVMRQIGDGITETDMGWLDEVMQGSIEKGIYAPFENLDMTKPTNMVKVAMGLVGESAGEGLAEGMSESTDKATDAADDMADDTIKSARGTFGTFSPSKEFAKIGGDLVDGLVVGVQRSTWRIRLAMVAMAREAIKAAKAALGIESPSKLFRDEVGKMMVRGIAVGVESETEQQQKAIANAARHMTAAARGGAISEVSRVTNDSRNQSVIINIDRMDASSKQDVEALAQRIAALQVRRQRGYGY